MKNILIATKPDDAHAIYVKLALEKIGHRADLWYTADFPSQQTHTFELEKDEVKWTLKGLNTFFKKEYDVVWYRRPYKPILSDILHEDDRKNAKKENLMLFETLWHVVFPHAIWINPPNTCQRVNSKLLQLKVAKKIGLNIPHTLISNDANEIKNFIQQNAENVIYKTLYPMAWFHAHEMRLIYTSKISMIDLPNDLIMQQTPGIFQEAIPKKYELRITYFGNQYIAVKIHSQQNEKSSIDWRKAPTKELILEQVELPSIIDKLCQKLMNHFGIIFGCFDFIVTPDDEYYFLEINEQGQFLWIEDVNPEIKMLQAFVKFIASIGQNETISLPSMPLLAFEYEMMRIKNKAMELHQNPASF